MKLLIASDLHGSAHYCEKLLARIEAEQPDKILLLGDLLYHGPRNDLPEGYAPKQVIPMLNGLKDKIIAVRGNCDAEVDQMVLEFPIMADYTTLLLENGRTLFATHGHLFDPDHLPPLPAGSAYTCEILNHATGDTATLDAGQAARLTAILRAAGEMYSFCKVGKTHCARAGYTV